MNSNVLVVHHDRRLVHALAGHLWNWGYTCEGCDSAEEAIEHLREGYFDIVLIDLTLKETDGLELCRWCRRAHTSVPVVLMSAGSDLGVEELAQEAGACAFLKKPVEPDQLARVLAWSLDR